MTITSNNPSYLLVLLAIIVGGIVLYLIISAFQLRKRRDELDEVARMIKERHSKIEDYRIKKERANEEEIITNDTYWTNE